VLPYGLALSWMPQPAIHVLLATSLLQHWRDSPSLSPFACDDATSSAFIHGSLGPDLGLFPGGAPELSRLAHFGRTGALLRSIAGHSTTDTERAYAWGWLTHILADIAIHPLVNRAAVEKYGVRTLAGHVRVEVGLDTHFTWQHSVLTAFRVSPVFGNAGFAFVRRAYNEVHQLALTDAQMAAMQRGMVRFTNLSLLFATSLARELCWRDARAASGRSSAATALWQVASRVAPRDTLVEAYLNPLLPVPWLLDDVGGIIDGFNDVVDGYVASGIEGMPDYNLETGETI
jgi:hypothetical protein